MDIESRIEAAIEWRQHIGTQGQSSWEAKNSAAIKTAIGTWELVSAVAYVTIDPEIDATIPVTYMWAHRRVFLQESR